jgi:hypothetical protein
MAGRGGNRLLALSHILKSYFHDSPDQGRVDDGHSLHGYRYHDGPP